MIHPQTAGLSYCREDPSCGFVRVPGTFLVAEVDGQLVGRVSIRHELNAHLRREGGHIGYGVRPGFRGRGHATRMLALGLQRLAELGFDEVLVTCDHDNVGSIRVIERCGGRHVATTTNAEGVPTHHYLVPTR